MKKLRVWWVPQVPMQAFYVYVASVDEGRKIMSVLAEYDMFQYKNKVKPDYCNAGGLEEFDENDQEWVDWYDEDEDCNNPFEYLEMTSKKDLGAINES